METFVVFIIKSKDENFDLSYLINVSSRKERQEKILRIPNIGEKLRFNYDFLNKYTENWKNTTPQKDGRFYRYELRRIIPRFNNEEMNEHKIRVVKSCGIKSSHPTYKDMFECLIRKISRKCFKVVDIMSDIDYIRSSKKSYIEVYVYLEEV